MSRSIKRCRRNSDRSHQVKKRQEGVARPEFIRGTRSKAPYGYSREGKPNREPQTNLLAWILTILLLSALAIVSWLAPAYVFRNPHIPFNYELLRKLEKLEDLKAFNATKPPRQRRQQFFSARELFNQESGRSEEQLAVINDLQKRLYIQNFEHGEMLGYIKGRFEIFEHRLLTEDDVFPGLALRAKSLDFPNVILEYLLPIEGEFENPYPPGHILDIAEGGDLAAILHLSRLPQDRLSVTALSLWYKDRAFPDGSMLNVEVPGEINLRAEWPVFSGSVADALDTP